jgi:hypothetical protein
VTRVKIFEKKKFKDLYRLLCTFNGKEDSNQKFKGDLLDLQSKLKDELPGFDPSKKKNSVSVEQQANNS